MLVNINPLIFDCSQTCHPSSHLSLSLPTTTSSLVQLADLSKWLGLTERKAGTQVCMQPTSLSQTQSLGCMSDLPF